MKTRLAVFAGMVLMAAVGNARAEKPLKDYSFIRGVNYGMQRDQTVLERDLGYAKRLNLNSTRIWLNQQGYEKDPKAYTDRLRNYVRTSQRLGFSTMPILWNGNSLRPDILKPEFRPRGEACVKGIVEAVKDEPGLLMWDILNEPFTNAYYDKAPAEDYQACSQQGESRQSGNPGDRGGAERQPERLQLLENVDGQDPGRGGICREPARGGRDGSHVRAPKRSDQDLARAAAREARP
jgi:hypothetical protein